MSRASNSAPPTWIATTRLNGGPTAAVVVYQAPGSNAIATVKAIREKLGELQNRFPEDLAWKITYDPTIFVTDTMHEVQKTLIEAFILVVIVVFLFLGSWRATLIPTLAVPVSLIGTFIALKMIGYSANTVSLLAIVLAIGIVVDDAIVVVENVERVMEEHPELSPAQATKKAMAEITAPIIAITLVLLSVFVPVAFIPGISGELFRQFAVTIAVSMFLSAINALTLSPALCGVLLKPQHGPRSGIMGKVMRGIDYVRDGYGSWVARIVRLSVIGIIMVLVASAGVGGLAKVTPTGFLPEDDQGAIFVIAQLPGGSSVARTSEVIRQAENTVKADPATHEYTSIIGLNFIDNYSQPNSGFMVVTFKPFEERKDKALGANETIARLGAKFREISGGTVVPLAPPPIVGLGTGGGFTYVLQDLARQRSERSRTRTARTGDRREPGSAAVTRVQHLLRDQPVDLSRYRPRQGADPRRAVEGCLPGVAGLAGRLLRQQHESVRPDLAGAGAGGSRGPLQHRRHLSHQCP